MLNPKKQYLQICMIFSDGCQNGSHFSKWLPLKDKVMYISRIMEDFYVQYNHALIGFRGQ